MMGIRAQTRTARTNVHEPRGGADGHIALHHGHHHRVLRPRRLLRPGAGLRVLGAAVVDRLLLPDGPRHRARRVGTGAPGGRVGTLASEELDDEVLVEDGALRAVVVEVETEAAACTGGCAKGSRGRGKGFP